MKSSKPKDPSAFTKTAFLGIASSTIEFILFINYAFYFSKFIKWSYFSGGALALDLLFFDCLLCIGSSILLLLGFCGLLFGQTWARKLCTLVLGIFIGLQALVLLPIVAFGLILSVSLNLMAPEILVDQIAGVVGGGIFFIALGVIGAIAILMIEKIFIFQHLRVKPLKENLIINTKI